MYIAGVDIMELRRFRDLRHPGRVAEYFLAPSELTEMRMRKDKIEFMASRFAAKEAIIKVLPIKVSPLEFKIVKIDKKPIVEFLNPDLNKYKISLSISHSVEYVVSFAIVHNLL